MHDRHPTENITSTKKCLLKKSMVLIQIDMYSFLTGHSHQRIPLVQTLTER